MRRILLATTALAGLSGAAHADTLPPLSAVFAIDPAATTTNAPLDIVGRDGQRTVLGILDPTHHTFAVPGLAGEVARAMGAEARAVQGGSVGALQGLGMGSGVLPPLDVSLAATDDPNAVMFGPGNTIAIYPDLSGIRGPSDGSINPLYFGKQRTSALFSATTRLDGEAEEQTVAITTILQTGAKRPYAAGTAYSPGDNIGIGNARYRALNNGITGTNSAPPAYRANPSQFIFDDGSMQWFWISDEAITAKLGPYIETSAKPGAGFSEGLTTNFRVWPGMDITQGVFAQEEDCNQDSGTDAAPIVSNVNCHVLAYGGTNKWLTGLLISANGTASGGPSAVWGVRLAGKLASEFDLGIVDTGGAKYGILIGNDGYSGPTSHSVSDFYNNSNSANGFLDQGVHSFAAMSLGGSGGTAISVTGSYANLFSALNFSVTAAGNIVDAAGATADPTIGSFDLTAPNASMEIGSTTATGSPFIDGHSSGSANDFDGRIQFAGGTAGTAGKGQIYLISALTTVTGTLQFGLYTNTPGTPTGYIAVQDGSGTVRHLAVVP